MNIPDDVMAEVYRHARDEFPNECCGWLTGPRGGDAVASVRRATNAYDPASHPTASDRSAETAYVMDSKDLYALSRDLAVSDNPPLVIYHSHPNGKAYFSDTDRKVATFTDNQDPEGPPYLDFPVFPVLQLVVGIDVDRVVEARLYDWSESEMKFVEVAAFAGDEWTARGAHLAESGFSRLGGIFRISVRRILAFLRNRKSRKS